MRLVATWILPACCALWTFAAAVAAHGDAPAARHEGPTASDPQFEATLEAHFDAIQHRDFDALMRTVTTDARLTLVFPDGTLLATTKEYADFHREWFADTGWKMSFSPISTRVLGDLAIGVVRTTYTDAKGPRDAILSLVFAREDGQWRLVHDQNTRVQ